MSATIEVVAERPERDEYDMYYHRYISLVPDGDVTVTLARAFPQTRELLDVSSVEQHKGRARCPDLPGVRPAACRVPRLQWCRVCRSTKP